MTKEEFIKKFPQVKLKYVNKYIKFDSGYNVRVSFEKIIKVHKEMIQDGVSKENIELLLYSSSDGDSSLIEDISLCGHRPATEEEIFASYNAFMENAEMTEKAAKQNEVWKKEKDRREYMRLRKIFEPEVQNKL